MVGSEADLVNYWFVGNLDRSFPIKLGTEVVKTGYDLNESTLLGLVREYHSVFYHTIPAQQVYFDSINPTANWNSIATLARQMFKFFPGCADCNGQMTVTRYIVELFDLIFLSCLDAQPLPPALAGIRALPLRRRSVKLRPSAIFNTEQMVHYLMLGGVLRDNEVTGFEFKVDDPNRKNTWTMRYIMMWCALQILSCMWIIKKTHVSIKHHRTYIYYGVMDFYMSLWFYAMHALHYGAMPGTGFKVEEKDLGTLKENETTLVDDLTPHTNGVLLEFEEFHFYYTSVYPMFKRKLAADVAMGGAADADSRLNLSTEVLGQALIDGFPMDQYNEMTNPAQTLKSIYEAMFNEWNTHIQHVSTAIHRDFNLPAGANPIAVQAIQYFAKPSDIVAMRNERANLSLTVDAFVDHMSAHWYWYHFRHITFNRMAMECKDYDDFLKTDGMDRPSVAASVAMWRRWYKDFSAAASLLR